MATKNLIPRGSGEGGIGITGTSWGSGVFNSGIFNDSLTVGGEQVALSSELSNYTTSDDLSECINYTVGLTGHIIPDTNAAYDLGNAEYKIRHLFLSDNSLHIGGTTISAGDTLGDIQFPSGITVTKDSFINGNLGVGGMGAANPDEALVVQGGAKLRGTNKLSFGNTSDQAYISAPSSNHLVLATDATQRVVIKPDGNVGIGTANPEHNLHISGATPGFKLEGSQPRIWFKENDQTDLNTLIRNNNSVFQIDTAADDDSLIANRLTILNTNGNVGIGTATPSYSLDVHTANGGGIGVQGASDVNNGWRLKPYGNDLQIVQNQGGGERLTIKDGGNVGIGTTEPGAKLDIDGAIHVSGVAMTPDEEGRMNFGPSGIMVGQAAVKPDPDNPESLFFQAIPQVKDTEGNAVTVLTADKLGLGTADVLTGIEDDLKFKLLTDQQRFVVGTTGDYGLESGWYRFNDFKVKGATDIGAHPINPVDTRIYSDESSFVLFKTDNVGNRVAHLVGGDEEVSPNNAIALGIAVKVDSAESPQDIEFVHTDGESYSVINGNSDSLGTNGLPIRQGFQNGSIGSNPTPLLIDGGSF